ncbi:DUF6215 domain-containing protein [Streptomyces lydicus]|uniref:DUF6215 domain-containing protein n=1 Tax=Streptomyces lydicus TaxID=47763 RepID=UPI00379697CC
MDDNSARSKKGMGAGAQAVAAVVLVSGLVGGMWGLRDLGDVSTDETKPAACDRAHDARPSKHVSGAQLCTALNRRDLPTLLGTPEERAETAGGSESWMKGAGGTKIVTPEATVQLKTYAVKLSASYDRLPVAQSVRWLGETAEAKKILGRPAVLYSDRTIALSFSFDGHKIGQSDSRPGGIARSLVVAKDAKDGGGSFEIALWRQDEGTPDDEALLRVAEKVLPTIPAWHAG